MEARLTGPTPEAGSQREKDFEEGTLILLSVKPAVLNRNF